MVLGVACEYLIQTKKVHVSLAALPLRIYVEGSGINSIIDLWMSHEIVQSNQIAEYM